jgi:hypothetical protein
MAIIIVPVIVAVVGALMYALSANPKLQEIGRLLFFCGALISVWVAANHAVKF